MYQWQRKVWKTIDLKISALFNLFLAAADWSKFR
jgi:hypothetical protein